MKIEFKKIKEADEKKINRLPEKDCNHKICNFDREVINSKLQRTEQIEKELNNVINKLQHYGSDGLKKIYYINAEELKKELSEIILEAKEK